MAEKRRKRKRKGPGQKGRVTSEATGEGVSSSAEHEGGGGFLQGIRSGFRQAAGVEQSKSSTLGNVIWTVVLLAAAALLVYRWSQ
jgi:hypothetical protein